LVGVKGISNWRLYKKIRWSYKLNFWDITQNLFHKNCFTEFFKNWVYWTKWLLLLKNKISKKLTEGKISYCISNLVWRDEIFADEWRDFVSTLQAHFLSMHAGKTFQNIFKNCKFDFWSLPNFGLFKKFINVGL
jgi:hypothetical protein